jgi:hypothetical protein
MLPSHATGPDGEITPCFGGQTTPAAPPRRSYYAAPQGARVIVMHLAHGPRGPSQRPRAVPRHHRPELAIASIPP